MIELTKVGGNKITINADLIKWVEGQPHTTTVTLVTENKFMVENSVREIVQKVVDYKRLTHIYEIDTAQEAMIDKKER